jgi:hypothetical protein
MNVKELNAKMDGKLNRKDRRAKEKKTGEKIIATNVPAKSTKVVTSKKSKHNSYNKSK